MTIAGTQGSLRWGYLEAASLSAWTLTRLEQGVGFRFSATATRVNTVRCTQSPLMLVVPHPKGQWRWPVQTLRIEGASLTGTLGPKE